MSGLVTLRLMVAVTSIGGQPDSLKVALQQATSDQERAELQFELANALLTDNFLESVQYARQAQQSAQAAGDTGMWAQACNLEAIGFQQRGDSEASMAGYLKALNLCKAIHDTVGIAAMSMNMGSLYHDNKQPHKAREHFDAALRIYTQDQDTAMIAQTLGNIANVLGELEERDSSLHYYMRAIELSEAVGDASELGYLHQNLSAHYQAAGDLDRALALQRQGLHTVPEAGDWERGRSWVEFAAIFAAMNRLDSAEHYARKALTASVADGWKPDIANASMQLYTVLEMANQRDSAWHYYKV